MCKQMHIYKCLSEPHPLHYCAVPIQAERFEPVPDEPSGAPLEPRAPSRPPLGLAPPLAAASSCLAASSTSLGLLAAVWS